MLFNFPQAFNHFAFVKAGCAISKAERRATDGQLLM
jgi:hypothetical protein